MRGAPSSCATRSTDSWSRSNSGRRASRRRPSSWSRWPEVRRPRSPPRPWRRSLVARRVTIRWCWSCRQTTSSVRTPGLHRQSVAPRWKRPVGASSRSVSFPPTRRRATGTSWQATPPARPTTPVRSRGFARSRTRRPLPRGSKPGAATGTAACSCSAPGATCASWPFTHRRSTMRSRMPTKTRRRTSDSCASMRRPSVVHRPSPWTTP